MIPFTFVNDLLHSHSTSLGASGTWIKPSYNLQKFRQEETAEQAEKLKSREMKEG